MNHQSHSLRPPGHADPPPGSIPRHQLGLTTVSRGSNRLWLRRRLWRPAADAAGQQLGRRGMDTISDAHGLLRLSIPLVRDSITEDRLRHAVRQGQVPAPESFAGCYAWREEDRAALADAVGVRVPGGHSEEEKQTAVTKEGPS